MPRLGLSLGIGTESCPYHDTYTHEYAVHLPVAGDDGAAASYLAARAFLVAPVTAECGPNSGSLPAIGSFVAAEGRGAMVPGVQFEDGVLTTRVLNLLHDRPSAVRLSGLVDFAGAEVTSEARVEGNALQLPPRALREVRVTVP